MTSFAAQVALRRRLNIHPPKKRIPRQKIPLTLSVTYYGVIRQRLEALNALVKRRVVSRLQRWVAEAKAMHPDSAAAGHDGRTDAPRDIGDELAALRLSLNAGKEDLRARVAAVGNRTAQENEEELGKQMAAAIGIEIPLRDPAIGQRLETWTEENVALIGSIEERFLGDVQSTVLGGLTAGDRWEDIADDIQERFLVSESKAALIARDQVGKFYGAVGKARQEDLGVTSYVWRTSLDERVRPEHADREGKTYKWNDSPEDGYPGQPVNCRCTAEPDLEDLLEGL